MSELRSLQGFVEKLFEFEGYAELAYWTRGHVDKEEFRREVEAEFGELFSISRVWHSYARNVPAGRAMPGQMIMYLDIEKGRGAYPITFIDLLV